MKCDEHRPNCINCSTSDRLCSFREPLLPRLTEKSGSSSSSSALTVIGRNGSASYPTQGLSPYGYDLAHMALLHHLETQVLKPDNVGFLTEAIEGSPLFEMLLKSAIKEPYLMDELLAISALHMSTLTSDPTEEQRYHHQATRLQTRALTFFNTSCPAASGENCIPMFLFSGLLGLHVLFDTASFRRDFSEFLDRFIQFLSLHRGVRIITKQHWQTISQTELRHIVNPMSDLDQQDLKLAESGIECNPLIAHLSAARDTLGPMGYSSCHEAIEGIRWITRQRQGLPRQLRTHVAMAWPIIISFDYLQMLRQRRPEALVILAHWAVFLHHDRDFWVFGDTGQFLIESISRYLGAYWDDFMIWPNKALKTK
jgi:hypothetical protein